MDETLNTTLYCQTGTISGCEYTVKVTCVDTTYVYVDETNPHFIQSQPIYPVCYTNWGKEYRDSLAAEAQRIVKRLACRSGWVELRKAFIEPIRHVLFPRRVARDSLGSSNIGCWNFARAQ